MSATFTATVAARLMAIAGSLVGWEPGPGPMPGIASIMAVALAAILASAAVMKLRALEATTAEFVQLRVPAPRIMARSIPGVEIITAVALVARPNLGAVVAAGLLIMFTAVLIATIRSGRSVSCGCLGAMSRQPVTVATVARNGAFLAMAAAAGTISSISAPDLASVMVSVTLTLTAVICVQLLALRQEMGRIWSVELAGEGRITEGSALRKEATS